LVFKVGVFQQQNKPPPLLLLMLELASKQPLY
jgi:hypothetical protein